MLDIFSTREIATGVYFLLFVIVFCFVPSVRKAFAAFLKTALSPVLKRFMENLIECRYHYSSEREFNRLFR